MPQNTFWRSQRDTPQLAAGRVHFYQNEYICIVKRSPRLLAVLSMVAFCNLSARAQIVIDPTFESSITSNANAAKIEAGINQAISRIESDIETPITVNIDFTTMSSGLGESDTYVGTTTYSSYRAQLAASATSTDDAIALTSRPVQTNNPVNGDADIELTLPSARALGYSGADPPVGQPDGTISVNLSLLNLSRTGS